MQWVSSEVCLTANHTELCKPKCCTQEVWMKGHLRERSPGHWAIVIDLGPREHGKRRQKWFNFKGTKRQAQVELARLISSRETLPSAGKLTVGQYLDKWVEE